MFFSSRAGLGFLGPFCRRMADALHAGIDIRSAVARESQRARGAARRPLMRLDEAIRRGESITAAFESADDFFPPLMRRMIEVGEATGRSAEVFAQLADHYQLRRELRHAFLLSILWPMVQLGLALAVVGLLIWLLGMVNAMTGGHVDPLGLGLIGGRGLAIYLAAVGGVALVIAGLIWSFRRGWWWAARCQRWALRLPVLGGALSDLALARVAWALHLTMGAGMDVPRAMEISMAAARNAKFDDDSIALRRSLAQGASIAEAFRGLSGYPDEFLDSLAVGEQSGRLSESLGVLSEQYQRRARDAMTTLTTVAGWLVWALVAGLIIIVIFRLAFFYLNTLNDAARWR